MEYQAAGTSRIPKCIQMAIRSKQNSSGIKEEYHTLGLARRCYMVGD